MIPKWKYDLKNTGKSLRQCINDGGEDLESCRKTLRELENCYKLIKSKVPEGDWEEISEEYRNVQHHIDILSIEDEIEREDRLLDENFTGYNPALECVNDDLHIFYNICDEYRIWVGI